MSARWPGVLAVLGLLCSLAFCAHAAPQLDLLTQPEPDATRQRAMRRLNLASAYYEQGQNHVAQQEVRAALLIDADFAEAYSLLGLIHQRENAPGLAESSFEQALQLASKPPVRFAELASIQHNYGWFLCSQNRFPEGQDQLTRAAGQVGYRQASKSWMALGVCQIRSGSQGQANASFQRALVLDPTNAFARYQLASLEWQAQQFDHAEATLAPLNASAQASAESLWLGVKLSRALAQPQQMLQRAQQLTQQFPQSAQTQAWRQSKFED
ncbi:MAG: type IV pilus biogenesis/stability protein PilW [Limnohabitans sp.]|nr:type IV pilus biogenesis/stability protein PilW [Limnohabitans sp.]